MNRQEIEKQVKKALSDISGFPESEIQSASFVVSDLNLESIDLVDFSYEIEKSLQSGIDMFEIFQSGPQASFGTLNDPTVQEVIEFIEKKAGK